MKSVQVKHQVAHIKKGDTVKVLSGNYRGTVARVLVVYPRKQRAVVEGVNMLTHFIKPTQKTPKGSIVKREGTIHISNLMFVDPLTNIPTRVGKRVNENGMLQRYSKKSNQFV